MYIKSFLFLRTLILRTKLIGAVFNDMKIFKKNFSLVLNTLILKFSLIKCKKGVIAVLGRTYLCMLFIAFI